MRQGQRLPSTAGNNAMERRVNAVLRHLVRVLAYAAVGMALTLLVVLVVCLNGRDDLQVWHRADLDLAVWRRARGAPSRRPSEKRCVACDVATALECVLHVSAGADASVPWAPASTEGVA